MDTVQITALIGAVASLLCTLVVGALTFFLKKTLSSLEKADEKNAAKITELQARQRELEKQRMELENLDIIGLVRGMGLSPDQLAALIKAAPPQPVPETERKEDSYETV